MSNRAACGMEGPEDDWAVVLTDMFDLFGRCAWYAALLLETVCRAQITSYRL